MTEKDREAISLSRQVEDGSNFSRRKKNSCLNKIGSVKKPVKADAAKVRYRSLAAKTTTHYLFLSKINLL